MSRDDSPSGFRAQLVELLATFRPAAVIFTVAARPISLAAAHALDSFACLELFQHAVIALA